MPLITVIATTSGNHPWWANSSTRVINADTAGISRAISPPTTNAPPSNSPTVVPVMTGRWLRPRQQMPPRCSGPELSAPTVHTAARPSVSQ
ncbi:hypothetical protein MAHJHV33_16570 [Mycobacterium avium subsp. hominissuis]